MTDFNVHAAIRRIDPDTHLAVVSAVPIAARHDREIVVRDRLVPSMREAIRVRDSLLEEVRLEIAARGDHVIDVTLELDMHPE